MGTILKASAMSTLESQVPCPAILIGGIIDGGERMEREVLRWDKTIDAWKGARARSRVKNESFLP